MFGGVNPAQVQSMMKKMGIKQEEIDALRVIIEKTDGGRIIIENPSVTKINMQGNDSWQITGEAKEESGGISEEDVLAVIEKTGVDRNKAEQVLKDSNGDLAEAILSLS